eukprot:s775_g1.t1
MHKLAVVLGVSTNLWTKPDAYHSLKSGRSPQSFLSYRVIGLTCAHGRLQEELIHELEPDLWAHTGFSQEGRSQCLIVVAADLCVASVRLAQQLPFGICFCDRKEAFDTQWRASLMVRLASCVQPRLWCVADDLLTTTTMNVVKSGARSKGFSITTGVVEGYNRRRASVDLRYAQEDAIMIKAEEEPTSWSAAVAAQVGLLQIPAVPAKLRCIDLLRGQRKAKLRHHVHNVIQPAVRKWEDRQWRRKHKKPAALGVFQ